MTGQKRLNKLMLVAVRKLILVMGIFYNSRLMDTIIFPQPFLKILVCLLYNLPVPLFPR